MVSVDRESGRAGVKSAWKIYQLDDMTGQCGQANLGVCIAYSIVLEAHPAKYTSTALLKRHLLVVYWRRCYVP